MLERNFIGKAMLHSDKCQICRIKLETRNPPFSDVSMPSSEKETFLDLRTHSGIGRKKKFISRKKK